MVDIVANPEWKSVRILERDEVALGGYGGNMNEQATALVARTELLMQEKADTSDIVQGQYSFSTLAEFDSKKATIPANSVVIIDEVGVNQGTNTWNGTTLTKSAYDPLAQAKEIIDGLDSLKINSGKDFPFLKLNRNGTQLEAGSFFKDAILDIKVKGATQSHVYKIDVFANGNSSSFNPTAWVIRRFNSLVEFESGAVGATVTSAQTAQQEIVSSRIQTIKITTVVEGLELLITIDPTKLPAFGNAIYASSDTSLGWNHIIDPVCYDYSQSKVAVSALSTEVKREITKRKEFFGVDGGGVTYDPITRVLTWSKTLLIQDSRISSNRINIFSGSITVPAGNFMQVYLDLTQVPADGNVTSELIPNCIKCASYTSGAYRDSIDVIPLVKIDPTSQGLARPCAGFLPVSNIGSGSTSNWDKSNIYFNKSADSAYFWQAGSKSNYIRTSLVRAMTSSDPASAADPTDVWRLTNSYEMSGETGNAVKSLVAGGEWDAALSYVGSTTHVGGWHGNEVITSAYFLCDGAYYAQDAVFDDYFKEVKLVQESNIFLQGLSDVMLKRKKIMSVAKNGIRNRQEFYWEIPKSLVTGFVTMLPVLRLSGAIQITDTDIRLPDNQVYDVATTDFDLVKTPIAAGSEIIVSGETSKLSAKLIVNEIEGLPSPNLFVSNSSNYNKMYLGAFNNTGGVRYTPSVGEKWVIDVTYQLNTSN